MSKIKRSRKSPTPSTVNLDPNIAAYRRPWLTDSAWITGLIGAITTVASAIWYAQTEALVKGVKLASWSITEHRNDSIILVLLIVMVVIFLSELVRIHVFSTDRQRFSLHIKLKKRRYLSFLLESVFHYLIYLLLIKLVMLFFHTAQEYGYENGANYYKIWFRFLEWAWFGYLWVGFALRDINPRIKK